MWEFPRKSRSRGAVSREGLLGENSAKGDPAVMGREFWLAKKCRQQHFKFLIIFFLAWRCSAIINVITNVIFHSKWH